MAAKGFIVSVYDLDLAPIGERVLPLPIRIGRSSLNDVCVSHRLVSEFHARIEEVDGRLCVRDLSSKNGVLVETVGGDGAARVGAQTAIDLEPYGYEFLLSPLLRVRVRPASGRDAVGARHSQAVGSVLGNAAFAVNPASALGEDQLTEGFAAYVPGTPPADARAPAGVAPAGVAPAAVAPRTPVAPAAPARGGVKPSSPPVAQLSTAAIGAPVDPAPQSIQPPPPLSPSSSPPRPDGGAPRPSRSAFAQTAQHGSPRSLSPASVSPAAQPYSSVFVEAPAGSLDLPPLPGSVRNGAQPALLPVQPLSPVQPLLPVQPLSPLPVHRSFTPQPAFTTQPALTPQHTVTPQAAPAAQPASLETRLSPAPPAARPQSTLFEPGAVSASEPPRLAHTAWEVGPGTLPAAAAQAVRPSEQPGRSVEALALRGLRELAASLVPGQSVDSAGDVVQLITKLHDAFEMFCRCFIPVREACSRFIPTEELERAAIERCRNGSPSYIAIERALEPRAVAGALLDWRNEDQDAPRAVEHILADLMLHHLALAQASLEGTRALLEELSPLRIESQQPAATPTMLSRLGLASTREKELWEAFQRRHAELESVGRTFRALFGDQFTRAYLAQAPMPGSGPSL